MARAKKTTDDPNEPPAHGWDAISAAFDELYGDQEPRHYGTLIRWRLGGPDPLDGLSAYKATDPVPHWHIVSYGMTELYAKEGDNPDVSGWGFEFTFRVARRAKDKEPPVWALSFLQNLGRYVFQSGNVFAANHHMNLNGPIEAENEKTLIRAVVFARDPKRPDPIDTPNGRVEFLQVVGVTLDELDAAMDWNTAGVVKLLAEHSPMLVTDLARRSILDDPKTARRVRKAAELEGSSLTGFFTPVAAWKAGKTGTATLTLVPDEAARVLRMLDGRSRHGRDFELWTPKQTIRFVRGKRSGWKADGGVLVVRLAVPEVHAMRTELKAEPGTHRWAGLKNFAVRVKSAGA